ncbi:hypothetical protein KQ944_07720 [Bacillus subtilis]|uniref:hypothetical protein n=1 Tax=Pseudochrobactrum asaccharolyticum TaxID=354351 RepID=UPI001F3B0E6F|nr:hypothetical protein [Pseudochrobactrum asaccharolyticum]MCF7645058.1 hypothetical protein [Pseudochrobactrum asaccharolyticum]MCF7671511.1 hypothetical protein [Bacillus subtilis]
MKHLLIALTCLSFLGTSSVNADTLAVDKIDLDINSYLQRILSGPDTACYEHIISSLIPESKHSEYYLRFEDTNQKTAVEVGSYDSSYLYTCIDGKLLSWDAGESTALKDFN